MGTEEDPYQVGTLEQLQLIGEREFLNKHFIQIAEIDASETGNWNDGKGFTPIGDDVVHFTGSYDGGGHIIEGLTINREEEEYIGLFAFVYVARIKNVGLVNINVLGGSKSGGLAGYNLAGQINNSFVRGDVSGSMDVGGLVGYNGGNGNISNSYVNGRVSGKDRVGGLAGFNSRGNIINTYAIGTVIGENEAGGLIGTNRHQGIVASSYASVEVTGNKDAGGFIGLNAHASIKSCYWNKESGKQEHGVGTGSSGGITVLITDQMTGTDAYEKMISFYFQMTEDDRR